MSRSKKEPPKRGSDPPTGDASQRKVLLEAIADILQRISWNGRRVLGRYLESQGLNVVHFHALNMLDDPEGKAFMPMRSLATKLGMPPSSLTSVVDGLVAAGLVERQPDSSDRRVTRVALTEQGWGQLRAVREMFASAYREAFAGLDLDELQTTLRVFERVFAHQAQAFSGETRGEKQ